ncbi:MAG: hypothetical protein F4X40_02180 [Chloroflexi bacterium]|nr:hypothetical protein [Chloroflexota bacterium]
MSYTIPSLLVIAAVGYLVVDGTYAIRFYHSRLSGYHVFFHSAIVGLLLFAATAVAVKPLHFRIEPFVDPLMYKDVDPAVTHLVLVFLAGVLLAGLINLLRRKDAEELKAMEAEGNHVDVLSNRAMEAGSPVQVSMKENNVYVGYILVRQNFDSARGALVLLPIFQAYRDQDGLKLHSASNYIERYGRILEANESIEEAAHGTVAISKSEITALEILNYDYLVELIRASD